MTEREINPETGEIIRWTTAPKAVFARSAYNYDRDAASAATAYVEKYKGRTKQEFKDDADINVIVQRFGVGKMPPMTTALPLDADFIEATTYQDALNTLMQAEQAFGELPANVRARFQNDPSELIRFVENEQNRDEAEKLGLVTTRNKGASSTGGSAPTSTSAPAAAPPAGASPPAPPTGP